MALGWQEEGAALEVSYVGFSIYCYLIKLFCSCRTQRMNLILCVSDETTLCNVDSFSSKGFPEVFCPGPLVCGAAVLCSRQSVALY